jgi:hypothetical protein
MSVTTTLNDLIIKLQAAIRDKDLGAAEAISGEIEAVNKETMLTARKVVYVCNTTRQPFNMTRTFGYVDVKPAKKGQRYSLTPIREYHDRIVYDDKHQIKVTFPAAEVAEDIVHSCNSDAGPINSDGDEEFKGSYLGVFLCAGDTPTDEELQESDQRLVAFDTFLVRKADEVWSEKHDYKEISGAQRRAAERLNIRREWLFAPEANVECPFCKGPMPKGAVIHAGPGGCGQVVDKVRYAEMTAPIPGTQVVAVGPGGVPITAKQADEISDADLDALTDPNKQ